MTLEETNTWTETNLGKSLSLTLSPYSRIHPSIQSFFLTLVDNASVPLTQTGGRYSPKLVFGTRGNKTDFAITTCAANTTYVEAGVLCMSRGTLGKAICGVESIRKLRAPLLAEEISLLEPLRVTYPNSNVTQDPLMLGRFFDGFMTLLGDVQMGSGQSSIEEWYMEDPNTAFSRASIESRTLIELSNVDIKTFEKRLALLYNTLWKSSWSYKSALGGKMTSPFLNTSSATVFPLPPVYAIHLPWIILYFVSLAIMFAASVFSLVMRA